MGISFASNFSGGGGANAFLLTPQAIGASAASGAATEYLPGAIGYPQNKLWLIRRPPPNNRLIIPMWNPIGTDPNYETEQPHFTYLVHNSTNIDWFDSDQNVPDHVASNTTVDIVVHAFDSFTGNVFYTTVCTLAPGELALIAYVGLGYYNAVTSWQVLSKV